MAIFFRIPSLLAWSVVILLAACGPSSEQRGLSFEDAWVRALPPGMKMTAGFGTLGNPGRADIVISSFSSPSFGDVSLHRTVLVDGVSKMREVAEISIPAGGNLVLEPGGYHLMLMMPAGEIEPGQTITVEITAADGSRFTFKLPVERR